ncbi:MAG: class I SAM-dependent methyltransferase [Planctomycetales bacterium]|nr:class I SAM-dependent methyltransferase [Planctomycetales bacterium]
MKSLVTENFSLEHLCRRLIRDESGIWRSERSEQCHYPADGARRLNFIEDGSFWFTHRRDCILEMIKRFPPEPFILDVGGGNGFVALGLQKAGFNAVLLEPSAEAVMNARRRGIDHIICSTVDQARFDPHSIPAAGVFDVLEHIEDDSAFLAKLKGLLVPGGKLYLTVPALPCLWSHEDRYAEHFRRYRRDLLCTQLRECGFAVDYATYFFSYLVMPLFVVKVIPTKLGLAKTYTHEQTQNEHVLPSGLKKTVVEMMNAWERKRIRRGNAVSPGTSIMIAAHAA